MSRASFVRAVGFALIWLGGSLHCVAMAQSYPTVLSGGELSRVVPTSFYFEGQAGPTQMRNAAAARLGAKSYVIAALVDTSGYSSDVRGKYEDS